MVALKSPLNDLELSPQAALYIGILERKLCALDINELKYRALLEMLTGETWDDLNMDLEAGEIKKIAIEATQKKMDVSYEAANKIVEDRIAGTNARTLEG